MKKKWAYHISFTGLFTAILAVCAMISIPMGDVKFSLQLLAVWLMAGLLPLYDALAAVAVYILLGALGVPIFAGLVGGVGILMGPTGGFIYGFLPAVLTAWLLLRFKKQRPLWYLCLSVIAGTLVCYLFGTIHFLIYMPGKGLAYTLTFTVLPYILPDVLKAAVAALVVRKVSPFFLKLFKKAED